MKFYKSLIVIALVLIPALSLNIQSVHAEDGEVLLVNEPMVLRFWTSAISGSSQNNQVLDIVRVGLTYTVYPKSNPGSQQKETVYVENGKSMTFEVIYPVSVIGTDGITYTGNFAFKVYYDTLTATLRVDDKDVTIDTKTIRNASVWPEAYVNASVVGVNIPPLPFSSVKAVISNDPNYISTFNEKINSGITDKIVLSTSQYGSNIQTETRIAMYIWLWHRLPDGTYDKSEEATKIQVIYSAADLLNGAATYSSWTGTQLYRQLVPATVSSHITKTETVPVWNGKYRSEYNVQDLLRTDYAWGFGNVIGAVSPITAGTCIESASKHCVSAYYQYSRYQIQCSDYWRTSFAYGWSVSNITTTTVGNTFCKNNTTKDYYRKVKATEVSSWIRATTYPGYTRTAQGYTYQVKVPSKIWGPSYWQIDTPDASQNYLGTRLVKVFVGAPTNFITIVKNNAVIPVANSLTEGDVNARVGIYATGAIDDSFLKSNQVNMPESMYWELMDIYFADANELAVSKFKEANYWGLYLYQTGHWRAVEIPINWFEIGGQTSGTISLSGSAITPPEPDHDGTTSLVDWTYIEALFNQLKNAHPNTPIARLQVLLLTELASNTNIMALKTLQLYDLYISKGNTQAQAFEIISEDFNINLIE